MLSFLTLILLWCVPAESRFRADNNNGGDNEDNSDRPAEGGLGMQIPILGFVNPGVPSYELDYGSDMEISDVEPDRVEPEGFFDQVQFQIDNHEQHMRDKLAGDETARLLERKREFREAIETINNHCALIIDTKMRPSQATLCELQAKRENDPQGLSNEEAHAFLVQLIKQSRRSKHLLYLVRKVEEMLQVASTPPAIAMMEFLIFVGDDVEQEGESDNSVVNNDNE